MSKSLKEWMMGRLHTDWSSIEVKENIEAFDSDKVQLAMQKLLYELWEAGYCIDALTVHKNGKK